MYRIAVVGPVDTGKTFLTTRLIPDLKIEEYANRTESISCYRYVHKEIEFLLIDTPGHQLLDFNKKLGILLADLIILLVDPFKSYDYSFLKNLLEEKEYFFILSKSDLLFKEKIDYKKITPSQYSKLYSVLTNNSLDAILYCDASTTSELKGCAFPFSKNQEINDLKNFINFYVSRRIKSSDLSFLYDVSLKNEYALLTNHAVEDLYYYSDQDRNIKKVTQDFRAKLQKNQVIYKTNLKNPPLIILCSKDKDRLAPINCLEALDQILLQPGSKEEQFKETILDLPIHFSICSENTIKQKNLKKLVENYFPNCTSTSYNKEPALIEESNVFNIVLVHNEKEKTTTKTITQKKLIIKSSYFYAIFEELINKAITEIIDLRKKVVNAQFDLSYAEVDSQFIFKNKDKELVTGVSTKGKFSVNDKILLKPSFISTTCTKGVILGIESNKKKYPVWNNSDIQPAFKIKLDSDWDSRYLKIILDKNIEITNYSENLLNNTNKEILKKIKGDAD